MIEPLNEAQQHWVATTFETLSTEAKVAQLLIPKCALVLSGQPASCRESLVW